MTPEEKAELIEELVPLVADRLVALLEAQVTNQAPSPVAAMVQQHIDRNREFTDTLRQKMLEKL